MIPEFKWLWSRFDNLSNDQLYDLLQARQEVFAVEQDCIYLDVDGVDKNAWHLLAYRNNVLLGYCRIVDPGVKYEEVSIGRVLTTQSARGTGLGKILLAKAIEHIEGLSEKPTIRLSAQQYLEKFYQSFGFKTVSEPYNEDGIPHIEMLRQIDVG